MKIFTFNKSIAFTAIASAMIMTGCQKEELMENQFTPTAAIEATNHGQLIEGQYIVVLKDGSINNINTNTTAVANQVAFANLRQAVMAKAGIRNEALKETFQGSIKGFAAKLSADQLKALRNSPEVAYIEQDRVIALAKPGSDTSTSGGGKATGGTSTKGGGKTTTTEPTTGTTAPTTTYTEITPLAGETVPWNVAMVGYGDGRGKTVWLIDSGIDTDHPDLTVDLARSVSFVPEVTSVEDGYGHGTSVAGVIAAKNNGSGLIGVAAGATVVALRVFDDAGKGTMSNVIAAVSHVYSYAKAGDVVNMSLGGGISTTLDDAIRSSASKGILFALAAGNSAVDCMNTSPARVDAPGVYTVSAHDNYGKFWSSSNYGMSVDIAAPGVNVVTTINNGSYSGGAFGTSFAAPHVAGVLLLRGKVYGSGYVTGDPDSKVDAIASVK